MIQTITPNRLLLYLYNESPADEAEELNAQLLIDEGLRNEKELLQATKHAIDFFKVEPSDEVVNRILDYSKNTAS